MADGSRTSATIGIIRPTTAAIVPESTRPGLRTATRTVAPSPVRHSVMRRPRKPVPPKTVISVMTGHQLLRRETATPPIAPAQSVELDYLLHAAGSQQTK